MTWLSCLAKPSVRLAARANRCLEKVLYLSGRVSRSEALGGSFPPRASRPKNALFAINYQLSTIYRDFARIPNLLQSGERKQTQKTLQHSILALEKYYHRHNTIQVPPCD